MPKLVGIRTALNSVQRIATIPLNERKINESPAEFYTCPAGKTAIIKGTALCTGVGAGTEVRLEANTVAVLEWLVATLDLVTRPFEVQLAAGESLRKQQDAGVNGEVNINATIQETIA